MKFEITSEIRAQIDSLTPSQEHILAVVEYLGANAGAAYIQGRINEERWLEADNATFQVEEAFLSTEYATMAQALRQEFVRENRGDTLADVHDIAEAIKRCGRLEDGDE